MHLEQDYQKRLETYSQMHCPYKSSTGLFSNYPTRST